MEKRNARIRIFYEAANKKSPLVFNEVGIII